MKNRFIWLAVGFASGAVLVWPLSRTFDHTAAAPNLASSQVGTDDVTGPLRLATRSPRKSASVPNLPPLRNQAESAKPTPPAVELVFESPQNEQNAIQASRSLYSMMVERDLARARLANVSLARSFAARSAAVASTQSQIAEVQFAQPVFDAPVVRNTGVPNLVMPVLLDLREDLRSQYGLVAFFDQGGAGGFEAFQLQTIAEQPVSDVVSNASDVVSNAPVDRVNPAPSIVSAAPPVGSELATPRQNDPTSFDNSNLPITSSPIDQMVAVVDVPVRNVPDLPTVAPVGPVQDVGGFDGQTPVDPVTQIPGDLVVADAGTPQTPGVDFPPYNPPANPGDDTVVDLAGLLTPDSGSHDPSKGGSFLDLHGGSPQSGATGPSDDAITPTVPEPGVLSLLLIGGLFVLRRRP